MDYKNAGVDIEAGYKAVELMKKHVQGTMRPEVLTGLGGEPLFFLDYIACGKNFPERIATIVSGVADGCRQSEAALIGGETAEMPGFYPEDEYDLAGFAVGIVDEKNLITGRDLKPGDVLVGMASSGVHSNGFSLVRKVFEMTKENLGTYHEELGTNLGRCQKSLSKSRSQ